MRIFWRFCGIIISKRHLPLPGDSSDPIQVKSIEVSPDPPKPGQNMTVKVTAYAQELIEVRASFHFLETSVM